MATLIQTNFIKVLNGAGGIVAASPVFFLNGDVSGCQVIADALNAYESGIYSTNADEKIATYQVDIDNYTYFGGYLYGNGTSINFDAQTNFNEKMVLPKFPTGSAPTYEKGAVYFDTTLNKMRIGGATGWETVTSV